MNIEAIVAKSFIPLEPDGIPNCSAACESGLERERIALAAATEIAKQLHPFSVVAFAIVAGFFLGRILKQDNKTPG